MDNELIVNSIKKLCDKNNIPIGQFEKEAGLSKGLISKWKEKTPSLDKIISIADYFNVSVDEVIGRKKDTANNCEDEFISTLIISKNKILEWTIDEYDRNKNKQINNKSYNEIFNLGRDEVEIYTAKYQKSCIYLVSQYYIDHENGTIEDLNIEIYLQPDPDSDPIIQKTSDILGKKILWYDVRKDLKGIPAQWKAKRIKNEIISKAKELQSEKTKENIDAIKENKEILNKLNTPEMKKLISVFSDPKMNETIKSVQNLVALYNKNN